MGKLPDHIGGLVEYRIVITTDDLLHGSVGCLGESQADFHRVCPCVVVRVQCGV